MQRIGSVWRRRVETMYWRTICGDHLRRRSNLSRKRRGVFAEEAMIERPEKTCQENGQRRKQRRAIFDGDGDPAEDDQQNAAQKHDLRSLLHPFAAW